MSRTGGGGREEQTVSPDARNTSSQAGSIYELSLPDVPPSLNKVGSRGNRWAYSRAKKSWGEMIFYALLEVQMPKGLERVEASAVLRFKDRRRRDEGNFRFMLEKALGDVLVDGGWLPDDDADRYSFGKLVFDPDPGDPLTTVALYVTPHPIDVAGAKAA